MRREVLGIPGKRLIGALAIAAAAGCLLGGYELIRSASQSLFLEHYGSRNLPIVMALGPAGTLLFIYGYGRLLSAVRPKLAFLITSLISGAGMLGCYFAIRHGFKPATGILYVWREAYIVVLVEQIWAFINSSLRLTDGRKLNGPICGIASAGSILGGLLIRRYAKSLGTANLLLFAAVSVIPAGIMGVLAYMAIGEPAQETRQAGRRMEHMGAATLWRSPVLRGLSMLVVLTQIVSTVLDLQLSRVLEQSITETDVRTYWFGGFYLLLNFAAAFCQFILSPLLMQVLSLRGVHLFIPIMHLATCAAVIARPSLETAAAALLVFKALDYSIFRAAKEILYIPLSFNARYRSKELIDAFGYRAAKGLASSALAAAGRVAIIPLAALPSIAIIAVGLWLPLVVHMTSPKILPPEALKA